MLDCMASCVLGRFFLLSVLVDGIEVIDDVWYDDFAYDTEGLNGWDTYYRIAPTNYDYTIIPFVNGSFGRYHGIYQENELSIHYLRRQFQCKNDSSVKLGYNMTFCGDETMDQTMVHMSGTFKFRIEFLQSTRLYPFNDPTIKSNYNCGSGQWYVYYDIAKSNRVETFISGGISFIIKIEVQLSTQEDIAAINGIIIICDPPITTTAPTADTPSPTDTTPSPTDTTSSPTDTTPSPTDITSFPTEITPSPTDKTSAPTADTPSPTDTTPSPTSTPITSMPSTSNPTTSIPSTSNPTTAVPKTNKPMISIAITSINEKEEQSVLTTAMNTNKPISDENKPESAEQNIDLFIYIIIGVVGLLCIMAIICSVLKYKKMKNHTTNDIHQIEIAMQSSQSPTINEMHQDNNTKNIKSEYDHKSDDTDVTKHNVNDSEDMYNNNDNGVTPQKEGDKIFKSITKGNDVITTTKGGIDNNIKDNNRSDSEQIYQNNEQIIDNHLDKMYITPNNAQLTDDKSNEGYIKHTNRTTDGFDV